MILRKTPLITLLLSCFLLFLFTECRTRKPISGGSESRKTKRRKFNITYDSLTSPLKEKRKENFWGLKEKSWADSVFKTLSTEEKIGQLFMVAAYSNRNAKHIQELDTLIQKYKIGGVIFFQGGPERQAAMTNHFQEIARIPLFVAIDGEWGISMRLDSTLIFPKQMTLGAVNDDSLLYHLGLIMGDECRRMGIHINFSPVADINSNPLNPVIGFRSFSEDKTKVTHKSIALAEGLQSRNIVACGKHFPGHGDTDKDSHYALPALMHSTERMDSVELYPFKALINRGIKSMMVAHVEVPAWDTSAHTGASLSKTIVQELLQDSLGYKGLVFTDALNMKGVTKFFKPGDLEIKALQAGNDMLLFSENVSIGIGAIKTAIDSGRISIDELDKHCLKILKAKEWAGLHRLKPIDKTNLVSQLNKPEARALQRKLFASSLTLLNNHDEIIPLRRIDTLRMATLSIGELQETHFQKTVSLYADACHYQMKNCSPGPVTDSIAEALKFYNIIAVSIDNATRKAENNFNITSETIRFINKLRICSRVILVMPANPYALGAFNGCDSLDAILLSYERNDITHSLAAQSLFGAIPIKGSLPVSVPPFFKQGEGAFTSACDRLSYVEPCELSLNEKYLARADSIIMEAIKQGATPGAQVLVAKGGKVFYHKSFGYFDYQKSKSVNNQSVYDLASITKVGASLFMSMRLFDRKKFSTESLLEDVLPQVAGTNKAKIVVKDILLHQAGLQPFIPFYKQINHGKWGETIVLSDSLSKLFPLEVARNIYASKLLSDSITRQTLRSPVKPSGKYVYSDIGFYLVKMMNENLSGVSQENYMHSIYRRLGAYTLTYRPLRKTDISNIVPTENDTLFRKQLIRGYVHDPGAALMGGVGGHAGLFGTANDLAKVMQTYLNKGTYGYERYLTSATIDFFNTCHACETGNRRGLGFDKPEPDPSKESPVSRMASPLTFGHTGFTGTCVWVDPENGLLFIFLSNRVHPDAENRKLVQMNVRTRLHDAFYKAISTKGE